MTLERILPLLVLACAAYLAVLYVGYFALVALGHVEARRRRRERAIDDADMLSASRFAPGVSIFVPAYNEGGGLADAVRSLLALSYPEYEVIVVNDGSNDDTLDRLVDAFDLVPVEVASREIVPSAPAEGYYRSPVDSRLLVVDKANGGKADALNAALNHCRYRYVCGVDADMAFAPGALTRAMREIAGDPEHVVGLTSYFENARDPVRVLEGRAAAGMARLAAPLRVPDVRLSPRVLQQPHPVGATQLHALRRRCVPAVEAGSRRGARRVVGRLHV